jgi:predicted enzyme related to lactoylglutathione lyase
MPDPFEALRAPVSPVDPDPDFATRLRARVERALVLPEGVIVSETTIETTPARSRPPVPDDPRRAGAATGLTPYLIVADSRQAIDWYVEVFGARRRGEPIVMADGRVGHAELELGTSALFLADESPESHVAAPRPGADATVSFVVEVPDVDAALRRAGNAGATVERPAADNPYGRNAVVRDPFGHRWIISAAPGVTTPTGAAVSSESADHTPGELMRPGDIGYASLWVPDLARAETFFGTVLGWSFDPGSSEQGRQVAGVTPHHGLWGGYERSTLFLCYLVDDVDAALARVRAAGGEADAPTEAPYGRIANCVDDQGTPFAVFLPPGGELGPRLAPNGTRPGDVSYVTLEVGDSSRTRAFYGAVLGWTFTPGRVDDGWQVDDARPMTGLHGGHDHTTGVPMYLVDDIGSAVGRVRAAGGTASDPERQPYGMSSNCSDDQGTRFYLGEL